jgi:hypothetical protein
VKTGCFGSCAERGVRTSENVIDDIDEGLEWNDGVIGLGSRLSPMLALVFVRLRVVGAIATPPWGLRSPVP